jgi:hypothetical protein
VGFGGLRWRGPSKHAGEGVVWDRESRRSGAETPVTAAWSRQSEWRRRLRALSRRSSFGRTQYPSAVVGGVAAVGAGMGPDLGLSGPWPLLALAGISVVAMNDVQCAKYN